LAFLCRVDSRTPGYPQTAFCLRRNMVILGLHLCSFKRAEAYESLVAAHGSCGFFRQQGLEIQIVRNLHEFQNTASMNKTIDQDVQSRQVLETGFLEGDFRDS
jgi:hypothetical protein